MGRRFSPVLDGTWRIVERGVPRGLEPVVDGLDCYVFQRRQRQSTTFQTYVMPVEKFWGRAL